VPEHHANQKRRDRRYGDDGRDQAEALGVAVGDGLGRLDRKLPGPGRRQGDRPPVGDDAPDVSAVDPRDGRTGETGAVDRQSTLGTPLGRFDPPQAVTALRAE